jgi:Fe-S-cluster containining protein
MLLKIEGHPADRGVQATSNPFAALYNRVAQSVLADLRSAKTPEAKRKVLQRAYASVDALGDQILARSGTQLACCSGCAFCCYFKVDVRAQQAFLIADYIRRYFTSEEIAAVVKKAKKNVDLIALMSAAEQEATNIECALLKDGRCSVYPVRPLACRKHHAQDVRPCKFAYDHPDQPDHPQAQKTYFPPYASALSVVAKAIHAAYTEAGYDSNAYDLNAAIVEALTNPKSEKRWRDGKNAFSSNALAKYE